MYECAFRPSRLRYLSCLLIDSSWRLYVTVPVSLKMSLPVITPDDDEDMEYFVSEFIDFFGSIFGPRKSIINQYSAQDDDLRDFSSPDTVIGMGELSEGEELIGAESSRTVDSAITAEGFTGFKSTPKDEFKSTPNGALKPIPNDGFSGFMSAPKPVST